MDSLALAPERRDVLECKAEIADLIHRYALNVRNLQATSCEELFTDGAAFVLREKKMDDPASDPFIREEIRGRAEVADYIARSTQGPVRVCPTISNLLIEVEGDAARSNCLMSSRSWPAGFGLLGQYDDTFRRDNGRWRFHTRMFTIFSETSD